MNHVFFVLLGAYLLCSIPKNVARDPGRVRGFALAAVVIRTPLFLVAGYLAARWGLFSRALVSPVYCPCWPRT